MSRPISSRTPNRPDLPVALALSSLVVLSFLGVGCCARTPDSSRTPSADEPSHLWWEGEAAIRTNFPQPAPPGKEAGAEKLSGETWLFTPAWSGETRYAEYEIDVPADGDYHLYARKFWKHGPYRWRFDAQPWQPVGRDVSLLDNETLRLHTPANWTHAGETRLKAGSRRLHIELTDPSSPAAFDAFFLTDGEFFPRGKLRPGEPWPTAPEGWFTFNDNTTFGTPSSIDLRYLNEPFAGASGRITRKGAQFVQKGQPVRLMAVGAGKEDVRLPRHLIDRQAQFLARRGVNLVRFHGGPFIASGPQAGQIDETLLDDLFYYIAAMKREGIYTHLSIYFQHWFDVSGLPQFPGYEKGQMPFALHFFNQEWQKLYRDWWTAILTRENPYTGTTMAKDPALFGIELLNEDSFFFWTFAEKNLPDSQWAIIETQFADWLAEKYGSPPAALDAWKKPLDRDRPEANRIAFVPLWSLFNNPGPRERDTARFLAETQRGFFDNGYRFVKEDLGYEGLVVASNWRTANTRFLGALDKWTNAGTDFFDHHGYFAPWEKKVAPGFGHGPGDLFADRSLARWDARSPTGRPARLELPFLPPQIDGQPQMVSEFAWPNHNRFRAEMPLIAYSLATQAGVDALVLFTLRGDTAWSPTVDAHHWPVATPAELGQFPAAALSYRLGLIEESKPVAKLQINIDEMMNLKGNDFTDPSSGDYNRAQEGRDESVQGVDMRHFAAGKVTVDFVENGPTRTERQPLEQYYNEEPALLRSANDQIQWNHRDGLFALHTPASQGVTGFLGAAGPVRLPDATVDLNNEFAAIWLVAMDGRPLAGSRKILLQIMTEQRNHGYRTEGHPRKEIHSLGTAPVEVREISGRISLSRPDAARLKVTALDANGVPVETLPAADHIDLLPDRLYYLIETP